MKFNTIQLFIFFLVCCGQNVTKNNVKNTDTLIENKANMKTTSVSFLKKRIEVDSVLEGQMVYGVFPFINEGPNELVIEYVNPDCICTNYELSSRYVSPSNEGYVKLVFDTKGKIGKQAIKAIIKTNSSEEFHKIVLQVNIISK